MTYEIIRLTDRPDWKEQAASWFHEKWGIPKEEYLNSMEECLEGKSPVPQWYLAVEDGRIIGGMGVIENDFHERKDLAPNVCAVYTERDRRGRGIAGALPGEVRDSCQQGQVKGLPDVVLVPDLLRLVAADAPAGLQYVQCLVHTSLVLSFLMTAYRG